ncbi:MAG TPA: apolipoprotein N-acyltransferase [Nocardioidaceae bacterium]|nr:apolipoprotein N-acyltransferase [Nocardioidaceae bacterium]
MLIARLALAALAGAAVGVSFEPLRLVYLLPFAIALFALVCHEVSLRGGFLLGTVFGLAFLLVLLPWLQVIGVDAWIGVALLEALFYGLLGLGTVAVLRLPPWPLLTAFLWVGVEMLRGVLPFGGFPWGRLAFATVDTPVAPLFAYTGAAGATLAVALVGTVLAWTATRVRRTPARAVAVLVLTCLLASIGSAFPLNSPSPSENADSVTVAAVQGNVPGEGMNAFSERRAVLDNHVTATKDFAAQVESGEAPAPDIVIWPENSTDIDPFTDPTVNADIQEAVDAVGVPVLVGAIVDGEEPTDVLNQGIVWRPGTGPGQRYSKTHPVPFGEYIPFRDQLARYITRLDQIPRDMVPGSEPGLLEMNGTIVGDVICFEVAYDALVRDVVRGGAEVLVVQTNNATYMGTGQIEQQFAISRLRAIESGRYLVVAATNGVSGIISPRGKVVERAPTRTQAVLTHTLQPATGITAGIRFGVWIEMSVSLLATVGLALGVATGFRRRRDHAKGPSPEKHYVDA